MIATDAPNAQPTEEEEPTEEQIEEESKKSTIDPFFEKNESDIFFRFRKEEKIG